MTFDADPAEANPNYDSHQIKLGTRLITLTDNLIRLDDEVKQINERKSAVYKQAKAEGFDKATVKTLVGRLQMSAEQMAAQDTRNDNVARYLASMQLARELLRVRAREDEEFDRAAPSAPAHEAHDDRGGEAKTKESAEQAEHY